MLSLTAPPIFAPCDFVAASFLVRQLRIIYRSVPHKCVLFHSCVCDQFNMASTDTGTGTKWQRMEERQRRILKRRHEDGGVQTIDDARGSHHAADVDRVEARDGQAKSDFGLKQAEPTESNSDTWTLVLSADFSSAALTIEPGENHYLTSLDESNGINAVKSILSELMCQLSGDSEQPKRLRRQPYPDVRSKSIGSSALYCQGKLAQCGF